MENDTLKQVPAIVFACLRADEMRITICPGAGLADGGSPLNVPLDQIPTDLRMPNTPLWIHFDKDWNILHVWKRED